MIGFFRKIRRKLANENQFLKYSRYAIGEILLVVIGILIALKINNWNQNQQQKKVEIETLKALAVEFKENRNSIQTCQDEIKKMRLFGDSLRMQIGPGHTTLTIDGLNRLIGEIGTTQKCKVSIDMLKDIQGSGKLNLISNEEIRTLIGRWSSYRQELEAEENDWAQEFSNQFIPYTNKWIQWDDVDFQFNDGEPGYFNSRFNIDSRLILQEPEFSNIIAIQYWRITRIEFRTNSFLKNTDNLLALIQQELKE